jgi:hypothetical protein
MSGWTNVTPPFARPPRQRYERWEFVGELRNGVMPTRIELALFDGVWRVTVDGLGCVEPFALEEGKPFAEVVEAALECVAKRLHSVCGEVAESIRQAGEVAP